MILGLSKILGVHLTAEERPHVVGGAAGETNTDPNVVEWAVLKVFLIPYATIKIFQ